jgi:hypothetical protein
MAREWILAWLARSMGDCMNMKFTWVLCATAVVAALAHVAPVPVSAAPPWQRVALFRRVEADPEKSYELTEQAGPWMILAVSFSGEEAEKQARELVLELRKSYKWPAYLHRRSFDFSAPAEGKGIDQFGNPLKWKHSRDKKVEEFAVLVGDFQRIDDPAAQKILKRIKYEQPKCLQIDAAAGEKDYRSLGLLRELQKQVNEVAMSADLLSSTTKVRNVHRDRGPMGHAFITTNPLLPNEYFAPKGLDPLVVRMNEKAEFSLLDCPARYTVQVATFTGTVTIKQDLIADLETGRRGVKSRLAEAADKAHRLTAALREKGYEAYEFHDLQASIVCVGAFQSVGQKQENGTTELDPQIIKLMHTFSATDPTALGKAATGMGKPRSMLGIPFDLQAKLVEVPRRSIARDYDQQVVGLR